MKRIVLPVLMVLFTYLADAQVFKKGETVEVDANKSSDGNMRWLMARVVDIDMDTKLYVVKASDRNQYHIPFGKEESWIRRPENRSNKMQVVSNDSLHNCFATVDLVKQKIREEFANQYSEYDSITINYISVEQAEAFKNIDSDFGMEGSMVYPFKVDMMVRLVMIRDGVQKTVNTQVKKKYLIYQNTKGICDMTIAEKEERLMSKM